MKFFLSACLSLAALLIGTSAAFACSPAPNPPPKLTLAKNAKYVFYGIVTDVSDDGGVTVKVLEAYRGVQEKQPVEIWQGHGTDCAEHLKPGDRIVYMESDFKPIVPPMVRQKEKFPNRLAALRNGYKSGEAPVWPGFESLADPLEEIDDPKVRKQLEKEREEVKEAIRETVADVEKCRKHAPDGFEFTLKVWPGRVLKIEEVDPRAKELRHCVSRHGRKKFERKFSGGKFYVHLRVDGAGMALELKRSIPPATLRGF